MKHLLSAVKKDSALRQLKSALEDGNGTVAVFGLSESCRPLVISALYDSKTVLLIASATKIL